MSIRPASYYLGNHYILLAEDENTWILSTSSKIAYGQDQEIDLDMTEIMLK
jgi:hypothetical protein